MKKKKPVDSISGGLKGLTSPGSSSSRPSMSSGPSTKAAGKLTSMGFGSKRK